MQSYNEKSDVYSFGVILWELFMHQEPWQDKNAMQVSLSQCSAVPSMQSMHPPPSSCLMQLACLRTLCSVRYSYVALLFGKM